MVSLAGTLGVVTAEAAYDAIQRARMGDLSDVGAVEEYIQGAIQTWLDKYGPQFGTQLAAMAEPATKKAMEVVRPQVEDALKSYIPQFAAIAGGLMGLSLIFGVWIAKTAQGKPI